MAKIPIEIVLQDPDNPIVPDTPGGDSGENTSISVPNTAIGEGGITTSTTKENSEVIFEGSSASVITASAIVLVLAISAIVMLLVHRYHTRKKTTHKEASLTRKERLATAATSTMAVLAATVLISQLLMATTNAATDDSTYLDVVDKIQIVANRYSDVTIVATNKNVSYATTDTTFGYKVFMSMAGDTANLYLDGDTNSEYYFAPTESAGLDDNSWGYSLDGKANYSAMPLVDDALLIKQNISAATDEEIDVYYTMKADKDMPFGVYKGEIEYTINGYNGFSASLKKMQDMTSAQCAEVYTPSPTDTVVPTATLTDTRDNKTYTIAKLADGKCWMTQNLDLSLGNTIEPLTSKNTNLTVAGTGIYADEHYTVDETGMITWTPDNNTITTNLSENWTNSATNPYSYDPGDVYYYTTGDGTNEIAIDKETCETAHPDGSCAHYHAGNYYNWSAAIASNDSSTLGPNEGDQYKNAANSICPAGWELPNGPQENSDLFKNNDFNTLLSSYDGVITGDRPTYCGGLCPFYNYAEGGFNKIRSNPLWLVRSGDVSGGSLGGTGSYGYYWSSTVYGSGSAYYLKFGDNGVDPSGSSNRNFGYSVRCVAQ